MRIVYNCTIGSMVDKLGDFELNQIYTGECSEMMARLPDGCIDLTVTSPPYDNLRAYHGYTFDFDAIAAQLWRVTKPGGVVVWVVGDATVKGSETGTSFRQALGFMELGFRLHDTMIYAKDAIVFPESSRYNQCFEYMFILSRGKPKSFNPILRRNKKHGKPSGFRQKDGTLKPIGYAFNRDYRKAVNIFSYGVGFNKSTKDKIAFSVPAIFPEALARDHIMSWSNPGDVVLDPMIGSGTTAKMAKQLGRRWIGFDISAEYVELARKRIVNTQSPLPGLITE